MNRTGLFIALGLALVIGLRSGFIPNTISGSPRCSMIPRPNFSAQADELAAFARDAAMWIAWAFAVPAIVALVVKMVRPDRPMMISGRAVVFLLVTMLLSAGILTNLTFKSYWGRPRPVMVTIQRPPEIRAVVGSARRMRAQLLVLFRRGRHRVLDLAPAALTPPLAAARLCRRGRFGTVTSVLRMAFGGHFFTDVATAGLVTFLVIWLVYGLIYRWPSTGAPTQRSRPR